MTETWEEAQDRLFYERHPEIKQFLDFAKRCYEEQEFDRDDMWIQLERITKCI